MKAELIDMMGSDIRVVNSARVSFNKESNWDFSNYETEEQAEESGGVIDWGYIYSDRWMGGYSVRHLPERDQKLINYLAKHNHWTPFSHVVITMRETVPIFVARQRFKHVVGFTYNEVSRRYVDDEPEFYAPKTWRKRAENKKQGSSDEVIERHPQMIEYSYSEGYSDFLGHAKALYEDMISGGVAPEQARMILPQSMYTSYYVTGSLAAWVRAYNLRKEETAQKEIQDLANQWNNVLSSIPEIKYSWEALTKA